MNSLFIDSRINTSKLKESTFKNQDSFNYNCNNWIFLIYLDENDVEFICDKSFKINVSYKDTVSYKFNINSKYVSFTNINHSDELIEKDLNKIFQSLNLIGKKNVVFSDFTKLLPALLYQKQFKEFLMMEIESKNYSHCFWNGQSELNSEFNREFVDKGWRKACNSKNSYLFCCHSKNNNKLVNLSKKDTLAIILSIVIISICIFISLWIIAYIKFKNYERVGPASNENP